MPFEDVYLEPEHKELLKNLVEADRNVPPEQRQKFLLMKHFGGGSLMHPGINVQVIRVGPTEVVAGAADRTETPLIYGLDGAFCGGNGGSKRKGTAVERLEL